MQIASLVMQARQLLLDNGTHLRTSDAELIGWYNEAMTRICDINPFALTQSVKHACTEEAEQTLSSGARVLDVVRQLAHQTLSPVSADLLDREDPTWHDKPPSPRVYHWASHIDPTKFYVYPVPARSVWLECVVQKQPTDATRLTDEVEVSNEHTPMITDYLVYRGLLQDADNVENQALANDFHAKFEATVARQLQREIQRRGV